MIEKIKKKLIALLQSFCNLLHSVFVEKNKLSYDEKLRLALENDDLIYEEMHEEYKVPYSKRGLIFWRIKNYFKGMFRNIPSLLLWTLISFALTTGISYLYRCVIEPFLEHHSWKYINIIREKVIYLYPYIFGDDAWGKWFDNKLTNPGFGYVKGFDEPWQFIYRRYDHWYDTGTIGGATEEWVAIGIFSIFFTFALLGLIGTIISKIRRTGVKSLFVDFIKIPKTVYEYGKRSKKKVFDHFLAGVIISFIAGFFIKNPVAMPLFGITLLISFTMKQDSDKAFNHYTKECAKKMQDGEEKPLFADSALFCWGLGIGFLLYSYVGYTVWNDYDFCFRARLYETLIWTALALLIYVIRNGRKSTKVVARSLLMAFGAISGVMMCSFTAGATFLGHIYDKDGKIIGVRLILDNVCDGTPECSFGTALRNGMGGGLAGANAKANMAKRRKAARDAARDQGIPQVEELTEKDWNELSNSEKHDKLEGLFNTLRSAARGNGDVDQYGNPDTKYLINIDIDNYSLQHKTHDGKITNADLEKYNNLVERVNKYIRGDVNEKDVYKWNANPETAEQINRRIDNQARDQAVYETAKEVAKGKTPAAMAVRTGAAYVSGGSSEVYIRSMEAGFNMQEGVNSGKYDNAEQAFGGETANVVIEAGMDRITGGGKIPSNNAAAPNLGKEVRDTVVGRANEKVQESFTGGEDSFGEAASGAVANWLKKK